MSGGPRLSHRTGRLPVFRRTHDDPPFVNDDDEKNLRRVRNRGVPLHDLDAFEAPGLLQPSGDLVE